jgi:hypothetical protein
MLGSALTTGVELGDCGEEWWLLVPGLPARVPAEATVPAEAHDANHPDHIHWVRETGRCYAPGDHPCPPPAGDAEAVIPESADG